MDCLLKISKNNIILNANPKACELLKVPLNELINNPIDSIFEAQELNIWIQLKERHIKGLPSEFACITGNQAADIHINGIFSYDPLSNELSFLFESLDKEKVNINKKLQNISQEFNDFAYIISHDLNAPIRAIKTLATWIRQDNFDKIDEDGKQQLQLLDKKVSVLESLITGVLEYSRIGRFTQPDTIFTLKDIFIQIITDVENPHNIPILLPQTFPHINADRIRIYQLFLYLVDNAIRYNNKNENGQIEINYSIENTYFQIEVKDNGEGIETRHYEKVFQIFRKLHSDDSRTGIGLTLAKKIARLYQGSIQIESQVGLHTIVTVKFPKKILVTTNTNL